MTCDVCESRDDASLTPSALHQIQSDKLTMLGARQRPTRASDRSSILLIPPEAGSKGPAPTGDNEKENEERSVLMAWVELSVNAKHSVTSGGFGEKLSRPCTRKRRRRS